MKKRICVDMSATLLHHGHTRLLKKAAKLGTVVVALRTDDGTKKQKGYVPELNYEERKEILESIRYVDEIIPFDFFLDDAYLDKHHIDLLVHGDDNINMVAPEKLVIFPRTEGISSSELRSRVIDTLVSINIAKDENNQTNNVARSLFDIIKREFRMD